MIGDNDPTALAADPARRLRHDFNNALAAVMGSLKIVARRHPDDGATQALVDNALNSCVDLQGLMGRATGKPDE